MNKKWILLRGWGRGVGHWGEFLETVTAAFPDDQFEFLEIPGNGQLCQQSSPLNVTEMVSEIRKQSQFVKNQSQVRLVGMSLGGMIATEWARLFPSEVEFLCVINSSASNSGKFYERLRTENLPKILKIIQEKSVRSREQKILEMVANSPERRAAALDLWTSESQTHPVSGKNHLRQLLAASRFRFPNTSPVKTFLIGSIQDGLVSVQCTERLAEKWRCPLFLHPWAGHDVPLDDPEWVIGCLKKMQSL